MVLYWILYFSLNWSDILCPALTIKDNEPNQTHTKTKQQ